MPATTPEIAGSYPQEQAEQDVAELRGNVSILTEAHTMTDTTVNPPNTPTGGHTGFSSSGHRKYQSSDGNAYNVGRQTVFLGSNQTINSTTMATVLSVGVGAGTYRIQVKAFAVQGATSHTQGIQLTGPATSAARIWSENYALATTGESIFGDTQAFGTEMQVAAWGVSSNFVINIYCVATFTASGNVNFQARAPVAADTWTVGSMSTWMDCLPIT